MNYECNECFGFNHHVPGCSEGLKRALRQVNSLKNTSNKYGSIEVEYVDVDAIINQFEWLYNECTTR